MTLEVFLYQSKPLLDKGGYEIGTMGRTPPLRKPVHESGNRGREEHHASETRGHMHMEIDSAFYHVQNSPHIHGCSPKSTLARF